MIGYALLLLQFPYQIRYTADVPAITGPPWYSVRNFWLLAGCVSVEWSMPVTVAAVGTAAATVFIVGPGGPGSVVFEQAAAIAASPVSRYILENDIGKTPREVMVFQSAGTVAALLTPISPGQHVAEQSLPGIERPRAR
jgi:hypothetical protein